MGNSLAERAVAVRSEEIGFEDDEVAVEGAAVHALRRSMRRVVRWRDQVARSGGDQVAFTRRSHGLHTAFTRPHGVHLQRHQARVGEAGRPVDHLRVWHLQAVERDGRCVATGSRATPSEAKQPLAISGDQCRGGQP